jgi:hypothetical protein
VPVPKRISGALSAWLVLTRAIFQPARSEVKAPRLSLPNPALPPAPLIMTVRFGASTKIHKVSKRHDQRAGGVGGRDRDPILCWHVRKRIDNWPPAFPLTAQDGF